MLIMNMTCPNHRIQRKRPSDNEWWSTESSLSTLLMWTMHTPDFLISDFIFSEGSPSRCPGFDYQSELHHGVCMCMYVCVCVLKHSDEVTALITNVDKAMLCV